MTGEQLFEIKTSEWGEYAQDLMTAHSLIGDKLYPMLEECERTGKKIVLQEINPDVDDPQMDVLMI